MAAYDIASGQDFAWTAGPVMLKVILQKLGLPYELNALATAGLLLLGVGLLLAVRSSRR